MRDEGPGIAAEALPHIFERFYRAPGDVQRAKGFGLGLYLARQLVALHGGRIWAAAAPGCGSRFTLALPLAGKEQHAAPPAPPSPHRSVPPAYSRRPLGGADRQGDSLSRDDDLAAAD